jgi:hypothetical protein
MAFPASRREIVERDQAREDLRSLALERRQPACNCEKGGGFMRVCCLFLPASWLLALLIDPLPGRPAGLLTSKKMTGREAGCKFLYRHKVPRGPFLALLLFFFLLPSTQHNFLRRNNPQKLAP